MGKTGGLGPFVFRRAAPLHSQPGRGPGRDAGSGWLYDDVEMKFHMRKQTILRILPVLLLAACGPDSAPEGGDLKPGEIRLIALEPLGPDPASRLLPNGAFDEWLGGLPAPAGFAAPQPHEGSTIRRDTRSGHLNISGYTARQTWTALNHATSPGERFHTIVELAPETRYTLKAVAVTTPGMHAGIGAFEIDADGGLRVLSRAVVAVAGTEPARYQGTFETVAGGTVMLASEALAGSTIPGSVTWSAWDLSVGAEAIEPPLAVDVPARRLLAHQALDQIRSQFALYGGGSAWAEALYPVEKNVARILREAEPLDSASVLGYEGYVLRKSDLAYYADTHDLTRGPDGADSPAWGAILKAERALAARGIQLAVIPVPDRIHLYVDRMYKAASDGPLPLLPHTLLVDRLLRHDVLALDPAPALWQLRNEGHAVYWRADGDVPSFTLRALAAMAAPAVRALLPESAVASGATYSVKVDTIPLEQRLIPELIPAQRGQVDAEDCAIHSVRQGGAPFTSPARSAVLAAGSYAVAHQIRGASFAAHLSHALGTGVAIPETNLADAAVPAYLMNDTLDGVKVVVFCFPDAALRSDGWE